MSEVAPSEFQEHVEFVGPFEHHAVVVDGWQVPLLEAHPQQGGTVLLSLDRRYGLELSLAEAERVVPFLATAIVLAAGFQTFPRSPTEDPPSFVPRLRPRRLTQLGDLPPHPPIPPSSA